MCWHAGGPSRCSALISCTLFVCRARLSGSRTRDQHGKGFWLEHPHRFFPSPCSFSRLSSSVFEYHSCFSTSSGIRHACSRPLPPMKGDNYGKPEQAYQASCMTCAYNPRVDVLCLVACRWQNPLIGWTSTADPMEHVARSALTFNTKESAVAFAIKSGFTPSVRMPNVRRPDRQKRYAGYGDNFRWPSVTPAPCNLVIQCIRVGYGEP